MDPKTPLDTPTPSRLGALLAEKVEQTKAAGLEKRARFAGRDPASQLLAEFDQDRKTKSFAEVASTYGTEQAFTGMELNAAEAQEERTALRNRSAGELAQDTGLGLVKGTYNLASGAARLGSEFGPGAGVEDLFASGLLGEFAQHQAEQMKAQRANLFAKGEENITQPLTEMQSSVSQVNRARVAAENAADQTENARLRDEAVEAGRLELLADAQRLGRDFGDGFANTISNPTNLTDTAVEQIPTLAMGPIAKGAVSTTAVANRAAALAAREGGEAGVTQALLNEARSTLQGRVMGGMVAATEAGGAMNQVSNEIMTMDREELVRRYPEIAEQLENGIDENVARANLAVDVGRNTALMVAPIAGTVGRLTSRFELDPLSAGTGGIARRTGTAASTVAGEMAEESVQGISSEVAGNVAGALAGDTEADFLDGAGIAGGQGAAGALGFAGALQAPAAAGAGVELAGKGAAAALRPVGAALNSRAEAARAAEQAQVKEQAEQANQTRRETLAEVDVSIQDAVTAAPTPATSALSETVESEPLLDPALKQELAGTNRVQALSTVIDTMREEASLPEDQRDASRSMDMMLFTLKTAGQLRQRLSEIKPDSPEANAIQRTLLAPEVVEIEEALPNLIQPDVLAEMLGAVQESPDFATPKSQKAAEQLAVLAEVAPDTVSSEAARSVALYQRLAPEKKAHLEKVAQMAEIREQHEVAYQRIGEADRKTPNIVTQEVTEAGWGSDRPSLAQYQRRIMGAMVKGDLASASRNMKALQHFARHYQNKATAYDTALAAGLKADPDSKVDVAYRTLDAEGQLTDMPTAWLIPSKPGSQNLVRHIFNDANTVADLYNQLATTYPELVKVNKTARTPLADSLSLPGEPQFLTTTQEVSNAPAADVPAPVTGDGSTDASVQPVVPQPAATEPAGKSVPVAEESEAAQQYRDEEARTDVEDPADNAVDPDEAARQLELEAALAAFETGKSEGGVDFNAAPEANLEEALALTDEQYLDRVNPGRQVTDEKTSEAIAEELADLEAPERAQKIGEVAGFEMKADGDYLYVVDGDNVIGRLGAKPSGTEFAVHPDHQGKGIGKAMMRELMLRNPLALTGGLSPAAQATRLSVLRDLRAENARLASIPKFLEAFNLDAQAKSLLARIPNGLATLQSAVKSARDGDRGPLNGLFLDQAPTLSKEQLLELDGLVNKIVPEVTKQLNQNLERSIKQGLRFDLDTGTWVERTGAKAGGWLEDLVDGKQDVAVGQYGAAVMEYGRDEDGKPYVRYQPEVAQAMALASLNWVINQVSAPINFDAEDLASMFPDGVPPHLKEAFSTMHFAVQPTRTIANDITRMLGARGKKDVSVTLTDGIPKGLALDAITALHDADALRLTQVEGTEVNRDGKPLKMTFIDLRNAPAVEAMKSLRKALGSRVLTQLLDPESEELPTFAPTNRLPTMVSGTDQKLSKAQQDQIRKTNAVKIYRNPSLLLFVDRMGERWLELLGKSTVDLKALHPDRAKSVEGVNDGLDYGLDHSRQLDMMIHDHAGEAADVTPIYWSHRIVSNGRVMQNGFGGQGDKQARELFSANKVTGDLSTDDTPLAKGYYLSLAQALGIKTELKKNAAAVAEIRERLMGEEYQSLFADIQSLLRGEGDLEALADSVQSKMAALPKVNSAKAIHALVTHARLLEARAQGEADQFTTYLGFELDGKTNGPINALVHFGLDHPSSRELLRKGGLFIDELRPRTISDEASLDGYSDLYTDVAVETETRIASELATREPRSRGANMLRAGLRMLTLAKQVKFNPDNTVTITRDMSKAGMVPTVYGSGARGVANQMAHDIMAGLVEYLSDVAMGEHEMDPSVVKSATYIMSQRWISDGKGSGYWAEVTPPNFKGKIEEIEFNEQHFQALVDNLVGNQKIDKDTREPAGASGIMRGAIEDQLKPVMDTFKLVFGASRLQMARFNTAYQAAYDAKRHELIEAGTLDPYHALSRKDEEAIRESLKHLVPAYPLQMTGGGLEGEGIFAGNKDYNGKFLVTNPKTGKTTPYQVNSLVGGMRMDINVRQYLSPGVKAAPLLTIGGGDATMMHLLKDHMDNSLNVYDGWEIGVDTISEKALAANNAVLGSWQFDLLGPVAKPLAELEGETLIEELGVETLGESLSVYQYSNESVEDYTGRVLEAFNALRDNLTAKAESVRKEKKEVFTKHRVSVDQMSGGENPATRGYTTDELLGFAADSEAEGPAPVAGESTELVQRLGADYQNGLATLGQFELQALLATFPFTDKVRAFVASRIAHLIPDDVQVFIGTPERIRAMQQAMFPGENLGDGKVPGVSYKGAAFLTVASEETLVHELVHLATLHLTQRHFAKAKGLTAAQRDAVRELEKMIEPFMALPARNEAMRSAQAEVRLQMDRGQPALAINEMLAWSLANTDINTQLTGVEAPGVLKKVAKTIRALVRRLLGLPNNTMVETFLDQMGSNFHRLARRPRLADTHTELATFQRLAGPTGAESHAEHLETMYRQFGLLLGQLRVRSSLKGLSEDASKMAQDHLTQKADQELSMLEDAGFDLSDREKHLFLVTQAVLSSNMALDPAVMSEMDKLFAHVMETLDESVFLSNPGTSDPAELDTARKMWNELFRNGRNRRDDEGRSVMLANFVAMSLSHEGLRAALNKIEPPKPEVAGETFDARMRNRVTRGFDWLSDRAMGTANASSQKVHLDRLALRLGQLQTQAAIKAARAERKSPIDRLEEKFKTGMSGLDTQAEKVANNQNLNGLVRQMVQWGRGVLSDDQAMANAENGLSLANQPRVPQLITDLVSELAGNTVSTARLHRLVNLTRHAVSRVRQQLREEAPADVRGFFKTPLSEQTWSELHRTVGQVDLQALGSMGMARLGQVVTDTAQRQNEISKLLGQLGPNQALYEQEARILAQAIARKDVGPRYRNAEALASLFGQANVPASQVRRLTPLLDRLVSLYALDHLSDLERTNLGGLLSREADGMQKLLNTMSTLVQRESRKGEQRQRFNRWKGYVPQSTDPRKQIVLANAKQAESLVKQGYKRVGYYSKDPIDPANDLAYYAVNWVGGQSTYNQGALQTVEGTLSGVNALTGQSLDPGVGTLITSEGVVSSIAARHKGTADRRLTPVYNQDGDVVAYERVLDPAVVAAHTGGRKDLALSIGIWLGRQAEEELADQMNGKVVGVLAERWKADKDTVRAKEYVAINTSKDPVIADTWKTIPRHTQDQLKAAFGDRVMIRRDMLRNAVGYRSASIADAFTGMSTLPQPVRQAIMDAVYVLPGIDYKKIVAAEKAIQGAVGTAKDWIVVRSGVVAIANGVANMFQLTASGINPLELPKLIARKAQETEIYLRNEKRLSRIRVELTAVKRPDEKNKLLLEQQRLLDANTRLSIAPLVFAGELPTIAEGLSEHDEYTLTGDFMKWIDKKAEQLPQGVLTAAKIAAISKDTALYQGLNRMIQFGDFTAKAVLYDKWIQEGMNPETALERISERFVNYNLNAGRSRDYLESMGLLWFWNYKLRVQKIVLATLRENPLRFLLSVTGADLVGSDSLWTSSGPMTHWEYSVGPDQLFRAPEVTLWHQLFR